LQPAQLQPTYANLNLLAANAAAAGSATDYYTSSAVDYYSRMRPLQPVYNTAETTEELVDR